MITWQTHLACVERVACHDCRLSESFRTSIVKANLATRKDYSCPEGWVIDQEPPAAKLRQMVRTLDAASAQTGAHAAPCCGSKISNLKSPIPQPQPLGTQDPGLRTNQP